MKKNYLEYFKLSLRTQLLALLAGFFVFNANAQTIDVVAANTDRPDPLVTQYTGTTGEVIFTTTGAFEAGTVFYLHTGLLEEDNVLDQATAASTLDLTWPASMFGAENLFITAATGSFNAETIDIETSSVQNVGGSTSATFYTMNGTGLRRLTTGPINTVSSDEIVLNVSLSTFNVDMDRPIKVQFSTDGTSFSDMTDTNTDDEWFAGSGAGIQFVLTSGQKNATTYFRVIQTGVGSDSFVAGVETWTLDADDFDLETGGIVEELSQFIATYTVSLPSISTVAFLDDSSSPVGSYNAGQSVEIEGTFVGGTDQVDDFNYTAVFNNGTERFQLENVTDANVGNTITVGGTIPTGVTLNDNWDVSIVAFTGSTPTFAIEETFSTGDGNMDDLVGAGGTLANASSPIIFAADEDRFAVTPELDIQTTDNASVSITIAKVSGSIAPAGTEIVLEYTTDGTTFTQIGTEIDLNSDLSEPIVFSSLVAGVVSSTTQFRVRQLSNNGANLSIWSLSGIEVLTGGTILADGDLIDYFTSNIFVGEPTVLLEPVAVPSGLIFPGSEVTLTYNITAGAFATGTTFDVILDNGTFDYIIGNATAITPGDSEDHTVVVTVPALVGGNYDIYLEASGNEVESNTRVLPVYSTILAITEITSNSGVQVGGEDAIFPGSEITVDYTIDGEIGAGAELMLEVRDYALDVADNGGYVIIATEMGTDGSITGTLPTGIDFDDDGSDDPFIRIKIGNGILAQSSTKFVEDENGDQINFQDFIETVFDFDQTVGNNPTDEDVFIGSGERSSSTLPFDFALGGSIDLSLNAFGGSYNGTPQDVYLQASIDDGATWTVIADEEYAGGNVFFSEDIPQALRSETTRLRFIYNMNGESAEFENQLRMDYITLRTSETTQANTDIRNISAQFQKPTVSLETLTSYDFITGEQLTIEYTTSGPFPANTAFAIVLAGPDGLETVIGEGTALGTASVDVTMPAFAYKENGDVTADELYDELRIIAFNKATPTTTYTPSETIIIDEDEQFLVIEGTSDEDGSYFFDEAGDRSLLTQAFDLTGANKVFLDFSFSSGLAATDNLLTLPVLQVSTDAGATFQNIAAEEDGLVGDGYLFGTDTYSAELPASAITAATHFRWYQPLNLGVNQDTWQVSGISIVLEKGNEITTFYNTENSDVTSTLDHPVVTEYLWEQADADTDPVFNGETYQFNWSRIFETTNVFPAGTIFEFVLYEGGNAVIDPTTNRPFITGASTDVGTFEGNVPFFVLADNYDVRLVAYIEDAENGNYFFYGDADGESSTTVGDLDVFLRAITTTFDFDENDVFYAGNTATFKIGLENDDLNDLDVSALYANLLVVDFDGGSRDLVLATQLGVADITVDLPPYVRGGYTFQVELSENAPLGEVGDILESDDLTNIESDFDENFLAGSGDLIYQTDNEVTNSGNTTYRVRFDYNANQFTQFSLYRSIDGGAFTLYQNFSGSNFVNNQTSGNTFLNNGQSIAWRWVVTSGDPDLNISDVRLETSGAGFDGSYITSSSTEVSFENNTGRGFITTRDFEATELANSTFLSFDLTFDEVPENMVANQFLVLESSIDGGVTYTTQKTYPEADAEETIDDETFLISITSEMKTSGVRFRFRQEERNDIDVLVKNVSILNGETLPFDYVGDFQSISDQAILVTGLSATESCLNDEVVIDFEVRGRMGADNIVTARYQEVGNNSNSDDFTVELNASSGTGQITVALPADDIFSSGDANKSFRFGLEYDDETNEDFDYSGQGPFSELSIEVVAPILTDAEFSFADPLACEMEETVVNIDDVQDYFRYEIRNSADGSVLGTLVYDPELGDTEVNIGMITSNISLELAITGLSSNGLECNSLVSTYTDDLEVQPVYQLYRRNEQNVPTLVSVGESQTICEGATGIVRLSANRLLESGVGGDLGSNIEWFRDDFNNPVATTSASVLGDNEVLASGSYFARITDGSCTYVTDFFTVIAVETPDRPEVTLTSGSLSFCEGDGEAVLEAPTGFAFYSWNTGETTRSITVESSGSYNVRVSNVPFDAGCSSPSSRSVVVETNDLPDFKVSTSTNSSSINTIENGTEFSRCNSFTVYFFDGFSLANNNGEVVINKDGEFFASSQNTSYRIEESGEYSFQWISSNLSSTCAVEPTTFTVAITESIEDAPTITASGDLTFCEGGSVTLTAQDGFAFYRWYKDGSTINTSSATLLVDNDGDYQVEVSNAPFSFGCISPRSTGIDVIVYSDPNMNLETNQSSSFLSEGEVIDVCDDENFALRADNTGGNPVVWYKDGVALPGSGNNTGSTTRSDLAITESGSYYAEVVLGGAAVEDQCTFRTPAVTVNISQPLAAATVASTGGNQFCQGEVNTTLTATGPAGTVVYRWYRSNNNASSFSSISDGDGTVNTLQVTGPGKYYVTVGAAEGCESVPSNVIEIKTISNADPNITVSTIESSCTDGSVTVQLSNTSLAFVYQLINQETGENVGTPVNGSSDNPRITLTGVTEAFGVLVQASYADGKGCSVTSTSSRGTITPDNVVLEISGNQLIANISGDDVDITWFRNDVELRNQAGNTSIRISDAATYRIDVTFRGGCVVSSNTIDLSGGVIPSGGTAGRIQAKSYPNPATDGVVNVDLDGNRLGKYTINIMTMTGQVMISQDMDKNVEDFSGQISVKGLEDGIYNMQVRNGQEVQNIRIFVNK